MKIRSIFNPYHLKTKRNLKRCNLRHILKFLPWFLGENENPGRKFQIFSKISDFFKNFRLFQKFQIFHQIQRLWWIDEKSEIFFRCCLRVRWKSGVFSILITWKLSVIWNGVIWGIFWNFCLDSWGKMKIPGENFRFFQKFQIFSKISDFFKNFRFFTKFSVCGELMKNLKFFSAAAWG